MTVQELRERVVKAEQKVEKCTNTIAKHEKQVQKKLDQIHKNGWEANRHLYYGDNYNPDALWNIGEYELKLEDVETAKRKLQDAERVLNNWKQKLETEEDKTNTIVFKLPECMKELKNELAKQWKEEGVENPEREAEGWVLNLYNRIKEVTGEVTSWDNIRFNGKALNGRVEGVKGIANVETIVAGGYNVQCLHMRVLVHKYIK